jgi:hypothetical protein
MSKLWTLISIVVGVSAVSALLGWMTFRLARTVQIGPLARLIFLSVVHPETLVSLRLPISGGMWGDLTFWHVKAGAGTTGVDLQNRLTSPMDAFPASAISSC